MNWNFDMTAAPKGGIKKTTHKGPNGQDVERETYEAPQIIAAGRCGVVTLSRWNPKREAWSMFSADVPPIAWMEWPAAPVAAQ